MKIFCCIESYLPGERGGGGVRALSNLTRHLGDAHEFFIFTRNHDYQDAEPYPDIETDRWIRRGKVSVFYASNPRPEKELQSEIRRVEPDWLYLHGALPPLTRLVLGMRTRGALPMALPVLLAPHGNLAPASLAHHAWRKRIWLYWAGMRRLYRGIAWHAASEREARQIRAKFGERATIRAVPMAPPLLDDLPSPYPLPVATAMDFRLKLVYFGRLSPEKNLPYALNVLKVWADVNRGWEVRYDLIGPLDPDYQQSLLQQLEGAPENLKVGFPGAMTHQKLMRHLHTERRYDALLMPSHTENFSYTILESLLAGIPVIVSDQTPWRDLKTAGVGWDLTLERPEVWYQALDDLVGQNPQERQARADRARSFARDWVMGYPSKASGLFHPSKCSIGHEADD